MLLAQAKKLWWQAADSQKKLKIYLVISFYHKSVLTVACLWKTVFCPAHNFCIKLF